MSILPSEPDAASNASEHAAGSGLRLNWRRMLILAGKLTISLTLVYLVFRKADLGQFKSVLENVDGGLVALAALLLGMQMAVHATIWQLVVSSVGIRMEMRDSAAVLLFSLFLNQGLPAALGGIGGRAYFTWRAGHPMAHAATATLAERLLFLAVLVVFVGAALIPFHHYLDASQASTYGLFIGALAVTLGPGMALAYRFADKWRDAPILNKFSKAADGIREVLSRPLPALGSVLLMAAYHVLSLAALVAICRAAGVNTDISILVMAFPHVLLAAALPISVNGWGVRELATVTFLGTVGVTSEQALVVSLAFGMAIFVTRVPMAAAWVRLRKMRENP